MLAEVGLAVATRAGARLADVFGARASRNTVLRLVDALPEPQLTELHDDRLPQWIEAVRADDLSSLHAFVNGLARDLATVTAGLTLPWSSSVVEGHVNRLKMLKRQLYGRAGFALLRKRVLLAS
ncbi:transposase [Streptomyces shenzhenensis]|uniref:transposase n=1 Tax=Streptomyces shenzhenensis TaxID=943815 RepID=UPI0033FF3196